MPGNTSFPVDAAPTLSLVDIDDQRAIVKTHPRELPVEPLPDTFFRRDKQDWSFDDVAESLLDEIANRPWTEITYRSWAMAGTTVSISRHYIEPSTFLYYLPSLFMSVAEGEDGLAWFLESILPDNAERRPRDNPRGQWWQQFADCFTEQQRAALVAFIAEVRPSSSDKGGVAEYLLWQVEHFWP